jgi:hypothetical protein
MNLLLLHETLSDGRSSEKRDWVLRGKLLIILLIVVSPCLELHGQQQQFPSDFWHQGKLVLEGGDTLRGQIKYNLQNDLVQLQVNGRLETFTPRKAVFFEIFDQSVRKYRQFYSLPYAGDLQYKTPVFFELMEEGKMTLLCRENLEYKTYSSGYYYGSYTRLVLVNHFFFLKEDGSITRFSGNKNDLLDLMGDKSEQVKRFIKANKIGMDNKYGFAAAVEYYNSLFK